MLIKIVILKSATVIEKSRFDFKKFSQDDKKCSLDRENRKLLYLKSGVGEIEKVALTSESKKCSRSLPY